MIFTIPSLVTSCAICTGIFYFAKRYFERRRLYEMGSKFGGPVPVLPFIGNAHLLAGNFDLVLDKLIQLNDLYLAPFRLWLGSRLVIFVSDPDQMQTICVSPKTMEKSDLLDFSQPLFGEGIFTAPVAKWKVHRKLIQPTFNTKILNSFVEIFAARSKILVDQIDRYCDGPEFEVFHPISRCTLDMICETAMGVSVGAQTNEDSYYAEALTKSFASISRRFFDFWLQSDVIFYLTQVGKDQQKYIKYLHEFTHNVIQTKRKEFVQRSSASDTVDNNDDACKSMPRKEAFLDHLLKLTDENSELSDQVLRDEVQTMTIGGNETSAIADSFLMLMLSYYPDVQEKVYQELYEIYKDDDIETRPVTSKDLPRMKYLERVIKETLRLFPPGAFLIRAVSDDLDIGGHILPKDSSVILAVLNLHRNEKYWPEPMKFDPDRFLPDEASKRHPYAYLAFSGGPRNCIGLKYAMMAMKTVMATILRKYVLKSDNIVPLQDIRLKMEILLKPVEPIKIRIERRARHR